MTKTLTFITENPPLKTKGAGISVLLYNILIALQDNYKLGVITFCKGSGASCAEIEADNTGKDVFLCDRPIEKLYSKLGFGVIRSFFQYLAFLFSIPTIIKRTNNASNICITVVGASIQPVCKAWLLMKLARKTKHYLYIVDDLELINRTQNNRIEVFLINVFLKRTLKKADALITITDNLGKLYKEQFGVNYTTLLPHFKKAQTLKAKDPAIRVGEFEFIFTGGLSLLYNEPLQLFAQAIEQLDQEKRTPVTFKLVVQTYSSKTDYDKLNFNDHYVRYSTSNDREALLKTYQQADCFLIPYSFASDIKGMVATSFPQKIAEIIQYNKKILFFGPEDSSVGRFFDEHHLNYVCRELSIQRLKDMILEVGHDKTYDLSVYNDIYERYFSAKAVLNVFNKICN